MDLLATARKGALLTAVLALVAGCMTPQESGAPVDANQDGDLDGIPDGKSPEQGEPQADAGNSSVEENGSAGLPGGGDAPVNGSG